jgi:hypothetical protein
MPIAAHQEAADLLRGPLASVEADCTLHGQINRVRSALDEWEQSEYSWRNVAAR